MTEHLHSTFIPGCFRCDLGLDEVGDDGRVVIRAGDLRALAAAREERDADSEANMAVILLLRAVARECAEWRDGLPAELIENCEAAIRSDWDYLRSRYPDPEAALAREATDADR